MKNLILSDKEVDILDYVLGEFSLTSRRCVTLRGNEFSPIEYKTIRDKIQTAYWDKDNK